MIVTLQDKISFTQSLISKGKKQLSPDVSIPTKILSRRDHVRGGARNIEINGLKNNWGGEDCWDFSRYKILEYYKPVPMY